jgi:hypothetical protein
MDKGAQKTMKTPETQDKATTVNAFISARLNKVAKITDYSPMVRYLNGNHISVLYDNLPKTDAKQVIKSDGLQRYYDSVPIYGTKDAEMYLEWLISIVQGYEQESEEIKNKAYDQLCRFILILTDVTQWKDGYVLAKPYDWVTKLEEFEADISGNINEELKNMKEMLEHRTDDIQYFGKKVNDLSDSNEKWMSDTADMLGLITKWMEKYSPILDGFEEDYQTLHPTKVKKK